MDNKNFQQILYCIFVKNFKNEESNIAYLDLSIVEKVVQMLLESNNFNGFSPQNLWELPMLSWELDLTNKKGSKVVLRILKCKVSFFGTALKGEFCQMIYSKRVCLKLRDDNENLKQNLFFDQYVIQTKGMFNTHDTRA